MNLLESLCAQSPIANLVDQRNHAYFTLTDKTAGNKPQAAQDFVSASQAIFRALPAGVSKPGNSHAFFANVESTRRQTFEILDRNGRDNTIVDTLAPLAESLHLRH